MLAESLMAIPGRQSKLRVTMKFLRLTGRVVRRLVWETATDETLGLSAQMAYQFLFTLAPGLLFRFGFHFCLIHYFHIERREAADDQLK